MDLMALRELEDLLDVSLLRITRYRKEEGRVDIEAEFRNTWATCPTCGSRSTSRHSEKPVTIRDLPCFGRKTFLILPKRRFKCKSCKRPFTERLLFVDFDSSFTKRYEQYVFDQCYERSLITVARQEEISDTVVRKIYQSRSAVTSKKEKIDLIRVLGIDEISIKKGHKNFVCVITDIDRKKVIEVLPDRLKATLLSYFSELPLSVREGIEYVSIDMWEGYYQAVKEGLPEKVKVVIDRFHVMKQLNGALTRSRRELQNTLDEKTGEELKGLRWVLVTNECNLDDEQRAKLKELYDKCPELRECHKLKEEFRNIFENETSRGLAENKLKQWKQRARSTGLKSIEKFLKTLETWEDLIMNYFSSGKITNGVVEGLNNKIKLIKRRAYGFRNTSNMRQRILTECGGQTLVSESHISE